MKILAPLYISSIAFFGLISNSHAARFQIDFTGTVNYAYDSLGNVFTGGVAAGDNANGRFIYDDTVGMTLANIQEQIGLGQYVDYLRETDWITSSITVNQTTYSPSLMQNGDVDQSDYVVMQSSPAFGSLRIADEHYGDKISEGSYASHSAINLFTPPYDPLQVDTYLLTDFWREAPLLSQFRFIDTSYVDSTAVRNGEFYGNISSITVTQLNEANVPEPSSLGLMVVAVFGIWVKRRIGVTKR